ncbi:hypothetical protein DWB77_07246 [Streptomyces hundungensis]|uniref:Tetratricopeptide repeat protein n=1 Tax=Streptomyces hundungensis TaxID=1077946 RepID=A0A387HSB1_9ACTN|nr:tetratricopeptide repeat protein [Streptomyces hundungensis]AYG85030.1 hypothetical protein DWB77_07246 [Streptomyces hundungensis]
MLDTPEAVVEALRENNERAHGRQRTITAEELVEAAEPFEEPDVLVTALLELMSAYEFTGEHRKAPVVFARLLKLWDTTPASFSQWEAHQVFWRFKWVTTSLLQVPEVPLASVHGWIDQMRIRYEGADHGLQPVATMRYHVASHTGAGVADAYDLWATRPRTELSDCEACETRHFAWHQVLAGDDTGALDTWRPVLTEGMGCTEEPQMSQARALLPLLRTGRLDEARSHHLTGYRRVRGNTGMQDEVGLHVEFCALSRNEGRGLEILAENRSLFEATGAPLAHLDFLTGTEVLLARLAADGHDSTAVAGPPGKNWTIGELLTHIRSEASRLTRAFDDRNGTDAVSCRRQLRLNQGPLVAEPLPLGLRTSLPRQTSPTVLAATPAPAEPEAPQDFVALVREARRMAAVGHPGAERLWVRIAARLADGTAAHDDRLGPKDLLHAELAEQRAFLLAREDRHTESVAELKQATVLFEGLGMPWHALSARSRVLAWAATTVSDTQDDVAGEGQGADQATERLDADAVRAGLDEVLSEAERLKTAAPLGGGAFGIGEAATEEDPAAARVLEYLTVLFSRIFAAYQDVLRGLPEPSGSAVARFEESVRTLHSEAERLTVPHQTSNARQLTADLAGRRGDVERAVTELRAALQDVEASGRPWRGSRPRALLAQFLLTSNQWEEAAELLHQALADAVRFDDRDFAMAPTHALLGHAASHLGDTNRAVRHLSEAAARFDQNGDHDEAASTRLQLADVLTRAGQQADAVAVLESVLSDETASTLDERLVAQTRLTLARGLRELEEFLPAAEEFLRLADTVAAWEDEHELHTMTAAETAVTLAMAERWDAAGSAYERAVAAHAKGPRPSQITQMMCEFARLVMLARGADAVDVALDHLAQADAVRSAVPDGTEGFVPWYEAGAVHYRRARVLADAEAFPKALAEAEAAVAAYEQGGEYGEAPRAEAVRIAALVEGNGLGQFKEAIARLATAAQRARKADLAEAAQILDALRQDYQRRQQG